MNTPEVERLVTVALQADAEDAMNRTDTPEQLRSLISAADRDDRSRRRLRFVGALAASAAAVATVVVVASTRDGNPDSAPPVSPPPRDSLVAEAEQISTRFFEALAAFDRDVAATYVAAGAKPTLGTVMRGESELDPWALRNRFDEATGWKVTDLAGCDALTTQAPQIEVRCEYTAHQLGSERLGRGPFGSNVLNVSVRDGVIVGTSLMMAHSTNGFAVNMYEPFWEWIWANHPNDEAILAAFEDPDASPDRVDRSLQRWQQRVQQYVDAVHSGQAK